MAKQPVSDLFSTLKSYAQKLSDGERTPAEIAAALNDWAHESGQTLKAKITEEVESAVRKMGFVQRDEFDALAKEVAALKSAKKSAPKKRTGATVKKQPAKAKSRKRATSAAARNPRGAKR
jgi:BMFP domain-containing protein YqiC